MRLVGDGGGSVITASELDVERFCSSNSSDPIDGAFFRCLFIAIVNIFIAGIGFDPPYLPLAVSFLVLLGSGGCCDRCRLIDIAAATIMMEYGRGGFVSENIGTGGNSVYHVA